MRDYRITRRLLLAGLQAAVAAFVLLTVACAVETLGDEGTSLDLLADRDDGDHGSLFGEDLPLFSHARHSGAVFQVCSQCHGPAHTTTPTATAFQPAADGCLACHAGDMDESEHRLHFAANPGLSCLDCHGKTAQTSPPATCLTCHSTKT